MKVGDEVILTRSFTDRKVRVGVIEELATGQVRDENFRTYHYLKIKLAETGQSLWVPMEWCTSPQGIPLRKDLDTYVPNEKCHPSWLKRWVHWLLQVQSKEELERFERRRTKEQLSAVVKALKPAEKEQLRGLFISLGVEKDWFNPLPEDENIREAIRDSYEWLEFTWKQTQSVKDVRDILVVVRDFVAGLSLVNQINVTRWIWGKLSVPVKRMLAQISDGAVQFLFPWASAYKNLEFRI